VVVQHVPVYVLVDTYRIYLHVEHFALVDSNLASKLLLDLGPLSLISITFHGYMPELEFIPHICGCHFVIL
jgi:hypothetical protein